MKGIRGGMKPKHTKSVNGNIVLYKDLMVSNNLPTHSIELDYLTHVPSVCCRDRPDT